MEGFERPVPPRAGMPPGLDPRAATVLREIVEQYVATGEPVGSRTLSRRLPMALSPATIRNVMADLTDAGLLFSPHTSAGRLPTDRGLRLFVDGLLQTGSLAEEEREAISRKLEARGRSLAERSLAELRRTVGADMTADRTQLDALTTQVVEAGLATWTGEGRGGSLIVRGQARLLSEVTQIESLGAIQTLFERLEQQETMLRLLELAESSDGVRIFIGAESGLFGASGVSMVVAPARNGADRIVGAIGVIGPTRINYGRIIPVVDYTARVIGRLLG